MVYIPFVTCPADEPATVVDNVVAFPRAVSLLSKLRNAQRGVERCEERLSSRDVDSLPRAEAIAAITSAAALPMFQEQLREAETELAILEAGDTFTHRGRVYRAVPHSAGAN